MEQGDPPIAPTNFQTKGAIKKIINTGFSILYSGKVKSTLQPDNELLMIS